MYVRSCFVRRIILTAKKRVHVVFWECFLRRTIFHFSTIDWVPNMSQSGQELCRSYGLVSLVDWSAFEKCNLNVENFGTWTANLSTQHTEVAEEKFCSFFCSAYLPFECSELRRIDCDGEGGVWSGMGKSVMEKGQMLFGSSSRSILLGCLFTR